MNDFLGLVSCRFSCRSYFPDPVPKEDILRILEAARLAPSACNKQPWRFVVTTDETLRGKILEEGCLPGINMNWAKAAPVVLVLGMKKSLVTHKVAPLISNVDYSLIDIGIAGEHAVLQAAELGYGTCWIGWIKPKTVRKIIGWPKEILPQALITLGKPTSAPEKRTPRLSLDEIAEWK